MPFETNYTRTDASEFNVELFSEQDHLTHLEKLSTKDTQDQSQISRRSWAKAVEVAYLVDNNVVIPIGDDEVKVNSSYLVKTMGVGSNAQVSAMLNLGRVAHFRSTGTLPESLTDGPRAKVPEFANNMEAAWDEACPQGTPTRISFTKLCMILTGATTDDEVTVAEAINRACFVFGNVQDAMHIARPSVEPEESGDDDQKDAPKQSWQEMVAEAARRASEDGASLTDVVALVREVMG